MKQQTDNTQDKQVSSHTPKWEIYNSNSFHSNGKKMGWACDKETAQIICESVNNYEKLKADKAVLFTENDMKDFASFIRSCEFDLFSGNNWYYLHDGKLIEEDDILNHWLKNERNK